MNPLYVLIPLLAAVIALMYGVYRALGRVWLEQRIRLALLEKAEQRPELLGAFEEAADIVAALTNGSGSTRRHDYLLTGVLLAVIGIASSALGLYLHTGRVAVGIYIGGYVCVGLGVLIAFAGLFIRWAARRPPAQEKRA